MKTPHHYTLDQAKLGSVLVKYDIEPRGVCHVGAHDGEEVDYYQRLGFERIVLVEANPKLASNLRKRLGSSVDVIGRAAGAERGMAKLHVTRDTQMSSMLRPLNRGPFEDIEVPVTPLRYLIDQQINVLVIDVQGTELDVLAGADMDTLDLVVLEVGTSLNWYEGMPHRDAVIEYMDDAGWKPVYEFAHGSRAVWFDVAFVRKT